jgi:putative ABC transport system permease protein
MLKNYIKIAYRNLLSKKGYSAVNILGLSIGMTCCLLIFQYIAFEYSFDRFHQNERDLYRVLQTYARPGDELEQGHAFTAQSLGPALAEGVPEIVHVARLHSDNAVVSTPVHPERVFEEDGILYADRAFLSMFSFSLQKGDGARTLEPGTVLLSESMVEKYFGTEDPIGQVLEVK